MTRAEAMKRVMRIWDAERADLKMRKGKYGQPRDKYLLTFFAEELSDEELHEAIHNFLTDEWWNTEGKKYQDLEHFIRNYSNFMPDVYELPRKVSDSDIFILERE